jgi:hypothetical protein
MPMVASNVRFRKESGHGLTMSAYDPNRTSRGSALGASDSLIFSLSNPLLARKSISQIAG